MLSADFRRLPAALAVLAALGGPAPAASIAPGGTYVFADTDQSGLCALDARRIVNAAHGTIWAGGQPAPMAGAAALATRAGIAAGAVEYRHDGSLLGDVLNLTDDCFGITRVTIEVVPPVCGDGIVDAGEECDPGVEGVDACCGADCRLVPVITPEAVACRLRALVAWIRASDIRPAIQRTLIAALERVLSRIDRAAGEPDRRRASFVRSAGRRLGSFAARVRSYAGRQAITLAHRDFLLGVAEPMRAELAAMNGAP